MGLDYLLSSAIGFMAGVFLGFAMNKGWTFESSETSYIHLVKYVLIYCISLGISLLFLKYIIEANGINKYAGNIIAIGITTCTNFIGIKLLVFNR
jgi:putative flippase GtrA